MEGPTIQLDKSKIMNDFLKEQKMSKYLRKNIKIDFPSVLQLNAIPIVKSENNIVIHYTPPSGVKLTYMLPMLTRAVKIKAKGNYNPSKLDIELKKDTEDVESDKKSKVVSILQYYDK
jgi:hypothetical protein